VLIVVEYQRPYGFNFPVNPLQLLVELDLDLDNVLIEQFKRKSLQSGRSIDEMIIQILNDYIVEEDLGNQ
jgi:hypothetical protein